MVIISEYAQELLITCKAQINNRNVSGSVDLVGIVISSVAKVLDVTTSDLKSESRKTKVAEARFIVMYILVKVYKMRLISVASILNRDHSTVINGVRKYETLMDTKDKGFIYKVGLVQAELEGICV